MKTWINITSTIKLKEYDESWYDLSTEEITTHLKTIWEDEISPLVHLLYIGEVQKFFDSIKRETPKDVTTTPSVWAAYEVW